MKTIKFRTLEEGNLRYQKISSPTDIDTYTGVSDINGIPIYTNDLIKITATSEHEWLVVFDKEANGYKCLDRTTKDLIKIPLLSCYTITGNTHKI